MVTRYSFCSAGNFHSDNCFSRSRARAGKNLSDRSSDRFITLPLSSARNEAFRQGLRELGYVEGKNLLIEWRSYEGNLEPVSVLSRMS